MSQGGGLSVRLQPRDVHGPVLVSVSTAAARRRVSKAKYARHRRLCRRRRPARRRGRGQDCSGVRAKGGRVTVRGAARGSHRVPGPTCSYGRCGVRVTFGTAAMPVVADGLGGGEVWGCTGELTAKRVRGVARRCASRAPAHRLPGRRALLSTGRVVWTTTAPKRAVTAPGTPEWSQPPGATAVSLLGAGARGSVLPAARPTRGEVDDVAAARGAAAEPGAVQEVRTRRTAPTTAVATNGPGGCRRGQVAVRAAGGQSPLISGACTHAAPQDRAR